MTISNQKQTSVTETDSDMLTTAAKAIGTTLGKIAVKTGIAKAPAPAAKVRKKVASKKKPPAAKKVVAAKGKAALQEIAQEAGAEEVKQVPSRTKRPFNSGSCGIRKRTPSG